LSIFKQPSFLASSNIYCVNLRQYTAEGTFNAFSNHLPRLADMGVEIVWFMPIHPIGKVKRKGTLGSYYSISDYTDTNSEFGCKQDFKKLVDAAHALNIKVIIDWVANHSAWDNVWTKNHPDFFERDEQGNFKPPYDWDDVIQINHSNPQQQQAMIDAMLFWIREFDIDGFRADLAHLTPLPFWINARTQASAVKDNLIWLAETENVEYHQAFDISFTWKWMHDTEEFCKGQKPFSTLTDCLQFYKNNFPANALRLWFTSNHDENSWNGTAFEKYDNNVQALSVFNATYPGLPLIYSGEEDILNKRLKFFDKDIIEWSGSFKWHQFYKTLLHLRKSCNAINSNIESFLKWIPGANEKELLAFYRKRANSLLIVAINLSKANQECSINMPELNGHYKNVFTNEKLWLNEIITIELNAGGFVVLQSE